MLFFFMYLFLYNGCEHPFHNNRFPNFFFSKRKSDKIPSQIKRIFFSKIFHKFHESFSSFPENEVKLRNLSNRMKLFTDLRRNFSEMNPCSHHLIFW